MLVVVGASGYLGKPLYAAALKLGSALGTSRTDTALLPLSLETPDTFDYDAVAAPHTVFVTAGVSSPDACSQELARAWNVNVRGTSTVIARFLSRGARVIFFSSDAVYGETEEDCDESAASNSLGDYAQMKREVESRFVGNPAFKTVRLSLVFSYEDKFTTYLRQCAERQENAEVFHPFCRAVIHRDDVVEGVSALTRRWNEFPQAVINFGGPDVIARTEFAAVLKECALPELRFQKVEPRPDFFVNRPRIIRMKSPHLTSLLGRPPRSLRRAAELEFNRHQTAHHA